MQLPPYHFPFHATNSTTLGLAINLLLLLMMVVIVLVATTAMLVLL